MTATYYLLLKKQFVAEKKPFCDSFLIDNASESKFQQVRQKSKLRKDEFDGDKLILQL